MKKILFLAFALFLAFINVSEVAAQTNDCYKIDRSRPEWPSSPTGVESESALHSELLSLECFPNPFDKNITIKYELVKMSQVEVQILNMNGETIYKFAPETKEAGVYSLEWNGKNDKGIAQASGVYLLRISVGNRAKSVKIALQH